MKWRQKNNTMNQWNKRLVLWKDKQAWYTFSETKRKREITEINRITDEKGDTQQISKKSRGSLGNTSKTYILIDWKI
jgi:hypothetical protein